MSKTRASGSQTLGATVRRHALLPVCAATIAALLVASPSPSQATIPSSWTDEQVEFILDHQDGGAIRGPGNRVVPYFANIAAIGLVQSGDADAQDGALEWMQWYLGHLNPASPNVPAYSVFDYVYDPVTGGTTATNDFDSVDSYASTTLNLAYTAFTDGDTDLQSHVANNIATYEAIANLLTYSAPIGVRAQTGIEAGLTIAKPSYPIAFTMDNAEVYSGLVDMAQLETLLGRPSQAAYYQAWADTTQDAILDTLWNPTTGLWDWAAGDDADTTKFYADTVAQVWPTLYGVVAPSDYRAIAGWNQLESLAPNWYDVLPVDYPWTSITRAAQLMGEQSLAETSLANIRNRFVSGGWTSPTSCGAPPCGSWYANEAGWFIQASLN